MAGKVVQISPMPGSEEEGNGKQRMIRGCFLPTKAIVALAATLTAVSAVILTLALIFTVGGLGPADKTTAVFQDATGGSTSPTNVTASTIAAMSPQTATTTAATTATAASTTSTTAETTTTIEMTTTTTAATTTTTAATTTTTAATTTTTAAPTTTTAAPTAAP